MSAGCHNIAQLGRISAFDPVFDAGTISSPIEYMTR